MPTYCYECPENHQYEEVLKIADIDTPTKCPRCGNVGKRVISFRHSDPTFSEKLYSGGVGYYDPNLDRVITSAKHREKVMQEMGVTAKEGGRSTSLKQELYLLRHRMHLNPVR